MKMPSERALGAFAVITSADIERAMRDIRPPPAPVRELRDMDAREIAEIEKRYHAPVIGWDREHGRWR